MRPPRVAALLAITASLCSGSHHLLNGVRFTAANAAEEPAADSSRTSIDRDDRGFDEMLRTKDGQRQQWTSAPELVVLTSVLEYHTRGENEYLATDERLTDDEVDGLVGDLVVGLRLLTDGAFDAFARVHREAVPPGVMVNVIRSNQIVVARYRGVQTVEHTLGFGGRRTRRDGTITGAAIVLDSGFDRTSASRRLLRTHELGHALGYNHVESRVSIMNPRIGPEPTDFDRQVARLAFGHPTVLRD